MKSAIVNTEFSLYFQPQLQIYDQGIIGAMNTWDIIIRSGFGSDVRETYLVTDPSA